MSQKLTALLYSGLVLSLAASAQANPPIQAKLPSGQVVAVVGGPPSSSVTPTILPDAERAAEPGADTRRVCRQRDTMGTRLRAVRVCRTVAEWRAYDKVGRKQGKTLVNDRPDGMRDPRMGGG